MMSNTEVIKGAEPFFFKGSDIGVLVSHGFTGTPQSMRYYGEALHRAGYTVAGPLLKGHGTSPADMAKTTATDWIGSLKEALDQLRPVCKLIFITGLSMGGTLTLYMAGKYPDVFAGAIPINGCIQMESPDMAAMVLDTQSPPFLPGVGNDIKDPNSIELAYDEAPLSAFREAYMLNNVTRDLLPRIQCPTLIMHSREDHVINPSNLRAIAGLVGANRVETLWLENSYHVATIDNDKDFICEQACRFIRSIADR
jgi:carboxylesterase